MIVSEVLQFKMHYYVVQKFAFAFSTFNTFYLEKQNNEKIQITADGSTKGRHSLLTSSIQFYYSVISCRATGKNTILQYNTTNVHNHNVEVEE